MGYPKGLKHPDYRDKESSGYLVINISPAINGVPIDTANITNAMFQLYITEENGNSVILPIDTSNTENGIISTRIPNTIKAKSIQVAFTTDLGEGTVTIREDVIGIS